MDRIALYHLNITFPPSQIFQRDSVVCRKTGMQAEASMHEMIGSPGWGYYTVGGVHPQYVSLFKLLVVLVYLGILGSLVIRVVANCS